MQKNNHKLRIGMVGAGSIVRARHLPALKKHPEVEIVAVSNLTYESSEKFCRENLPHATPMQNWADLLALPELDIIWIGTPPYMHSAVTISALEAGKHVFCQARMSMDLAEAEEMLAASKRYPELVTMLCPPPMGMRADLPVRQRVAESLTYDFGSDVVQAGKLGDRALHVVDLAPELEGEWRVEEDFLAAVKSKGRVRPRPNFEEGVRYMRVVQAVADSRARNEWVQIKK